MCVHQSSMGIKWESIQIRACILHKAFCSRQASFCKRSGAHTQQAVLLTACCQGVTVAALVGHGDQFNVKELTQSC